MNFTSDVKKEIISRGVKRGAIGLAERKASISAFVRTCGTIGVKDGQPTFFLVSETENVAEYYMSAFAKAFRTELFVTHATWDRMSGRDKLLLQCPPNKAEEVLRELCLVQPNGDVYEGIAETLTETEETKAAYIRGAFLGGGSCMIPSEDGKSGYHLEFVFPDETTASDFCDVLANFELIARTTCRKDSYVVYIKSKEQISDFLSVVGAVNALRKFSAVVEKRDDANHKNRAQNCMSGNADKTAIAAVKQVVALQKLKSHVVWQDLSEDLKALAQIRLDTPSKSLQELADDCKVSKSCLNHRMRRLMDLANKIEE